MTQFENYIFIYFIKDLGYYFHEAIYDHLTNFITKYKNTI
jgi:hypothetical protein